MKRVLALLIATSCVIWIGGGTMYGAPQTWTGVISDSQCGGNHGGEVDERECTQMCISAGLKYVLTTNFGKTVWPIANQDFASLKQHPGHTVKVTGELKGDAIVISKIEM